MTRAPLHPATSKRCQTQHAHVAGHSVFVCVTFDGAKPSRVDIELHKEGSTLRGWAKAVADLITVGLGVGIPLEALVEPLVGVRCEPAGMVTDHDGITSATSILDYVGQALRVMGGGR